MNQIQTDEQYVQDVNRNVYFSFLSLNVARPFTVHNEEYEASPITTAQVREYEELTVNI